MQQEEAQPYRKQMKLPSFSFYPGDWLRDNVSGCSMAAQGLWLRMMLVMHDSERYGYFCSNGVAIPDETAARRTGCASVDEYRTLLAELERQSVPSRTSDGILFSRRMVRDHKKRSEDADRKRRSRDKNGHSSVTRLSASEDESESEAEITAEDIYQEYPLKVGKPDALKAITRKMDKFPASLLLERVKAYSLARNGDTAFVPNPSTWFNQERFNDDPATWKPRQGTVQQPTKPPPDYTKGF